MEWRRFTGAVGAGLGAEVVPERVPAHGPPSSLDIVDGGGGERRRGGGEPESLWRGGARRLRLDLIARVRAEALDGDASCAVTRGVRRSGLEAQGWPVGCCLRRGRRCTAVHGGAHMGRGVGGIDGG